MAKPLIFKSWHNIIQPIITVIMTNTVITTIANQQFSWSIILITYITKISCLQFFFFIFILFIIYIYIAQFSKFILFY